MPEADTPRVNIPISSPESGPSRALRLRVDMITNRQLSPDNIDTYANDALDELIEVVGDIMGEYHRQVIVASSDSTLEIERQALAHVGLDPEMVEATLDHIASVVDQLGQLDADIERATRHIEEVITPPDEAERIMIANDGSYEASELQSRLKTIVFVAMQEFGLGFDGDDKIAITTGALRGNMMRSASYNLVEMPSIDRSVLVCDEEGNVTYVLDDEALRSSEIDSQTLVVLTKEQLNTHLRDNPALGRRIIYGKNFVPAIVSALKHPLQEAEAKTSPETAGQYLQKREAPPPGVLPARGLRDKFNIHSATLSAAIEAVSEELGEIRHYLFYRKYTAGYDERQQAILERYLENAGLLVKDAEEGTLSTRQLLQQFGIAKPTLEQALEHLGDRLGPVGRYRFGSRRQPGLGYLPEQQALIAEHLRSIGKLKEAPPEGVVSRTGLMKLLGKDWTTIDGAIQRLGDALGEIKQYKFYALTTEGFTEGQQRMIKDYLVEAGAYTADIPQGYRSVAAFAKDLKRNRTLIDVVAEELGETLGKPARYRVSNNVADCYSPVQQQLIIRYLQEHGYYSEEAPEGIVAISRFSRNHGLHNDLVKAAVEELGEDLGEMPIYRFGKYYTQGLDQRQQDMLIRHFGIEKRQRAQQAPESVLSKAGLAKIIGVDRGTVEHAANKLGDALGEVKQYQFVTITTEGYDERQQQLIVEWINQNSRRASRRLGEVSLIKFRDNS